MRLKDNEPVYLAEEISRKVSIFTLWRDYYLTALIRVCGGREQQVEQKDGGNVWIG